MFRRNTTSENKTKVSLKYKLQLWSSDIKIEPGVIYLTITKGEITHYTMINFDGKKCFDCPITPSIKYPVQKGISTNPSNLDKTEYTKLLSTILEITAKNQHTFPEETANKVPIRKLSFNNLDFQAIEFIGMNQLALNQVFEEYEKNDTSPLKYFSLIKKLDKEDQTIEFKLGPNQVNINVKIEGGLVIIDGKAEPYPALEQKLSALAKTPPLNVKEPIPCFKNEEETCYDTYVARDLLRVARGEMPIYYPNSAQLFCEVATLIFPFESKNKRDTDRASFSHSLYALELIASRATYGKRNERGEDKPFMFRNTFDTAHLDLTNKKWTLKIALGKSLPTKYGTYPKKKTINYSDGYNLQLKYINRTDAPPLGQAKQGVTEPPCLIKNNRGKFFLLGLSKIGEPQCIPIASIKEFSKIDFPTDKSIKEIYISTKENAEIYKHIVSTNIHVPRHDNSRTYHGKLPFITKTPSNWSNLGYYTSRKKTIKNYCDQFEQIIKIQFTKEENKGDKQDKEDKEDRDYIDIVDDCMQDVISHRGMTGEASLLAHWLTHQIKMREIEFDEKDNKFTILLKLKSIFLEKLNDFYNGDVEYNIPDNIEEITREEIKENFSKHRSKHLFDDIEDNIIFIQFPNIDQAQKALESISYLYPNKQIDDDCMIQLTREEYSEIMGIEYVHDEFDELNEEDWEDYINNNNEITENNISNQNDDIFEDKSSENVWNYSRIMTICNNNNNDNSNINKRKASGNIRSNDTFLNMLSDVPDDGNCFYIALVLQLILPVIDNKENFAERVKLFWPEADINQLEHLRNEIKSDYVESDKIPKKLSETPRLEQCIRVLKEKIHDYVIKHWENYEGFFAEKTEEEKLLALQNDVEKNAWADEYIMNTIEKLIDCKITIYHYDPQQECFLKQEGRDSEDLNKEYKYHINLAHVNALNPFNYNLQNCPRNHYQQFFPDEKLLKNKKIKNQSSSNSNSEENYKENIEEEEEEQIRILNEIVEDIKHQFKCLYELGQLTYHNKKIKINVSEMNEHKKFISDLKDFFRPVSIDKDIVTLSMDQYKSIMGDDIFNQDNSDSDEDNDDKINRYNY